MANPFFDIFLGDAAGDAAMARKGGFTDAYAGAGSALSQGLGGALDYWGRAAQPYAQLFGRGNTLLDSSTGAYQDALGLNGPAGNAAARNRFQTGPGYDFALNQGLDQLDRRAAARGQLNSGRTNTDTINYATGTANQEWNNYLNRFSPLMSLGGSLAATGAQGQGTANAGAAGAYQNYGNNLADYSWKENTGIGDAQASADMARYGASQNLWNLLGNLGGSALKFGGGGGFGSMFGGGGGGASGMAPGEASAAWSSMLPMLA